MNSAIYTGWVRHRRYHPKNHQFRYAIFLLLLDLDELDHLAQQKQLSPWFGVNRFRLMHFKSQDYLAGTQNISTTQVWQQVQQLGGEHCAGKVYFLGQVRCLGIYFSPVNFYYCHDQQGELRYLLAEVSNTPWGEKHFYLIDAKQKDPTEKTFHVSPFMDLAMQYHWGFTELQDHLVIHIENHPHPKKADDSQPASPTHKLFDATLALDRQPLNRANLIKNLVRIPAMTVKTFAAIYWEALKITLKRIPYIPYQRKNEEI